MCGIFTIQKITVFKTQGTYLQGGLAVNLSDTNFGVSGLAGPLKKVYGAQGAFIILRALPAGINKRIAIAQSVAAAGVTVSRAPCDTVSRAPDTVRHRQPHLLSPSTAPPATVSRRQPRRLTQRGGRGPNCEQR